MATIRRLPSSSSVKPRPYRRADIGSGQEAGASRRRGTDGRPEGQRRPAGRCHRYLFEGLLPVDLFFM